jgi:hypothetical protein
MIIFLFILDDKTTPRVAFAKDTKNYKYFADNLK